MKPNLTKEQAAAIDAKNAKFLKSWTGRIEEIQGDNPDMGDGALMRMALAEVNLETEKQDRTIEREQHQLTTEAVWEHAEIQGQRVGYQKRQTEIQDRRHKDNRADRESVFKWLEVKAVEFGMNATACANELDKERFINAELSTIYKYCKDYLRDKKPPRKRSK